MDDMGSTPQLSETQSQSVDGTEVVTQDFMVPDQLETERLRIESKRAAHEKLVEEYRRKKHLAGSKAVRMAEYEEEFSTKLSLQKFIAVCEKLTEAQKQLVRDIGFGYLLDLCCRELPRCLVRWLVRYFDGPSRCFILPSGFRFFINSYTVHRILGIPLGGQIIPKKCSEAFRCQVKSETQCAAHAPNIRELIDLLTPELVGEVFQRVFVMFATAVFLCPTTYDCVSPDYLAALEGPATDISSYDWSGAILDKLVTSLQTFKDKGFTGALCGCLLIPVISYFEYLDIKVIDLKPDLPSRLIIWDTDTVKNYANLDRLSAEAGNFGKHSLKDISCTPFHPPTGFKGPFFQMSPKLEAYLEQFVPEDKLSSAKANIGKVVNEMYTELFSLIQPVIEEKLEKVLSLGRDFGAKEIKTFSSLRSTFSSLPCYRKTNSQSSCSSGSTSVIGATSYSLENLKGCCDTPESDSQNLYDKEQSHIRQSSVCKTSTRIKLMLEVNEIDYNNEDIDENARSHLAGVNYFLNNCLDGLPVHEHFVPTSEMLDSGAIILTGENSSEFTVPTATRSSGASADRDCVTRPLEKLLEKTGKDTATEASTSDSVIEKQLLHGPLSDETLEAPGSLIAQTSPITARSSGSDTAANSFSTDMKNLAVSEPAAKLDTVIEQCSSSLTKAQVDALSTLRVEKKIAGSESYGLQSKVSCSPAPTVGVPCGSGSGSGTALDPEKALASSSDAPYVAAASINTNDNVIAAAHAPCTEHPHIVPGVCAAVIRNEHLKQADARMAADKRSLLESVNAGNESMPPAKKRVRILEPVPNSPKGAPNRPVPVENRKALLDCGFIDDDKVWSDPSIYEQVDKAIEQQKRQAISHHVTFQECQPDTVMHLSKHSSSSARSALSYCPGSFMPSGSGSISGGSRLSQPFDMSYSVGLTQTALSESLTATALSQQCQQPAPDFNLHFSQRPDVQNNGGSQSSQRLPYGMNNKSYQHYQRQPPDCNSHFSHHNDVHNNGGSQSHQRPPDELNHQHPRGAQSHGQSYSALQPKFNNMQSSSPPLRHFSTDIPSSSSSHPGVGMSAMHMQQQPQGLMLQRNNHYNEGHQRLSNGQMSSSGPVFQHHHNPSQLEQPRFTDPRNDYQDCFQLLEIRDSSLMEKHVYETVVDNTPGIGQNNSQRIFTIRRRWADHRTLGLSMKVYGYMNTFVMDAYSELLMTEQFHKPPTNLHKHIMYMDASDKFTVEGASTELLKEHIVEKTVGYRLPNKCNLILIPVRKKEHFVYLIVVNFDKTRFEILCPYIDCDGIKEHSDVVIQNFKRAYYSAYNNHPHNMNNFSVQPVQSVCNSDREDDSGIYIMHLMPLIDFKTSFFINSIYVKPMREQLTFKMMTSIHNRGPTFDALRDVFRQYNIHRPRAPNRR